jgi:hypothetical protein
MTGVARSTASCGLQEAALTSCGVVVVAARVTAASQSWQHIAMHVISAVDEALN